MQVNQADIQKARNEKGNVLQEHFKRSVDSISDEEIRRWLAGEQDGPATSPKGTPAVSPPPAGLTGGRGLATDKARSGQ